MTDQPTAGAALTREWLIDIIREHTFPSDAADMILERLRTPASGPVEADDRLAVRVLVVENASDRAAVLQAVRTSELYRRGDTVQVWVNESDLYGNPAVQVERVDALALLTSREAGE